MELFTIISYNWWIFEHSGQLQTFRERKSFSFNTLKCSLMACLLLLFDAILMPWERSNTENWMRSLQHYMATQRLGRRILLIFASLNLFSNKRSRKMTILLSYTIYLSISDCFLFTFLNKKQNLLPFNTVPHL